jgi:hypothetical protein
MANLNKYTSTEALNISYASDFKIQSAWSISNTEVTQDVSGYHTIFLQTDEDIYYGFSNSTNAILGTAANNLYLKGGDTIYQLAVPYGVQDGSDAIYLHALRKTSSDATARLVFT